MGTKFNIGFTEGEITELVEILAKEPWGRVYKLINSITSQYQSAKELRMMPMAKNPELTNTAEKEDTKATRTRAKKGAKK